LRARICDTSVFSASMAWRSRPRRFRRSARSLLGAAALAGDRFQFELALRHGFGALSCGPLPGARFRRRPPALLARGARGFALDARQVFLDLRQLVLAACDASPSRRRITCRPASMALLALAHLGLQRLALLVDLEHAAARFGDLRFERPTLFRWAAISHPALQAQPSSRDSRSACAMRCSMAPLSLHLGFQPAARALGFHVAFRQAAGAPRSAAARARSTPPAALVRLLLFLHLLASDFNSAAARFRSMAVLAASRSSRRYLPESTTAAGLPDRLQLGVAPRLLTPAA
jgi:hypothetical protein